MPSLGSRLPVNLVVSVPGHILTEPFKFAPLADLALRVNAERASIEKQRREILTLGQQVGIALLILLMGVALFNDIARQISG